MPLFIKAIQFVFVHRRQTLTGPFHQPFQSCMSYASGHVLFIKNRRAPTLCTFKKVKVEICIIISGIRHVDLVRYLRLKGRVCARGTKRTDRTYPKIDTFKRY